MLVLVASFATTGCSGAPSERGAVGIETTLLAPCCFNGTLDTHESDLARTLRAEIEERVAHGEGAAAIQASMVDRYGPKVLAMPNERHFGGVVVIAGLAAALVIGVTLLRVRSWLRAGRQADLPPPAPAAEAPERDYDERIDAELDALD